jgi:hypothetical protein
LGTVLQVDNHLRERERETEGGREVGKEGGMEGGREGEREREGAFSPPQIGWGNRKWTIITVFIYYWYPA